MRVVGFTAVGFHVLCLNLLEVRLAIDIGKQFLPAPLIVINNNKCLYPGICPIWLCDFAAIIINLQALFFQHLY